MINSLKPLLICLFCFLQMCFCCAQKQTQYRTHQGFYLSVAGGISQGNVNGYDNNSSVTIDGKGTEYDVLIGGAVRPRWIVHAMFTGKFLSPPTVNNTKLSDNYSFNESVLGLGGTHYTLRNYFITGNIGTGYFSFSDGKNKTSTDNGLSFFFKAGKEWWLTNQLGLGLALTYGRTKLTDHTDIGTKEKWNSSRFGIVLQLTLN